MAAKFLIAMLRFFFLEKSQHGNPIPQQRDTKEYLAERITLYYVIQVSRSEGGKS